MTEPTDPREGTELGGYDLVERIGSGGMGVVYRAIDADRREVALKLLHPHIGSDPEARDRLRREVIALQRVRGVAVARVLDAEADSDEAFIVTELVDGVSLDASVRGEGVFAGEELAQFAADLAGALDAVHSAGVIHRDLKPSNVMVTGSGPVLIDFGIAQIGDDARLTQAGTVIGTPGYLAPELLRGDVATPESDWWSWAAVLVFAATGRAAFGSGPVQAVLGRVGEGTPDLTGVSPGVAHALRGALASDAAARVLPEETLQALFDDAARIASAPTQAFGWGVVPSTEGVAVDGAATEVWGQTEQPPTAIQGPPTIAVTPSDRPQATRVLPAASATTPLRDLSMESAQISHAPETRTASPATHVMHGQPSSYPLAASYPMGYPGAAQGASSQPWGSAPEAFEPLGYPPTAQPWQQLPQLPTRTGSILALAGVVAATAAWVPMAGVILVVVITVLAASTQSAGEALDRRRAARGGARGKDVAAVAFAGPWHLVRSFVPGLLRALVSVALGAVAAAIVWTFGSGSYEWFTQGQSLLDDSTWTSGIVVGACAMALAMVSGPSSRVTRQGAARALRGIAPGTWGARVLVLLCLVWIAVAVAQLVLGPASRSLWG